MYQGKVHFFLGRGEGGWGILVFFSSKSVGPPLRFNKKPLTLKILTSIVQDSQNNIQQASDSNSGSDSDRLERIVGSSVTCNSSELNDSGDQAVDSQRV